jgi:hypothetical protein
MSNPAQDCPTPDQQPDQQPAGSPADLLDIPALALMNPGYVPFPGGPATPGPDPGWATIAGETHMSPDAVAAAMPPAPEAAAAQAAFLAGPHHAGVLEAAADAVRRGLALELRPDILDQLLLALVGRLARAFPTHFARLLSGGAAGARKRLCVSFTGAIPGDFWIECVGTAVEVAVAPACRPFVNAARRPWRGAPPGAATAAAASLAAAGRVVFDYVATRGGTIWATSPAAATEPIYAPPAVVLRGSRADWEAQVDLCAAALEAFAPAPADAPSPAPAGAPPPAAPQARAEPGMRAGPAVIVVPRGGPPAARGGAPAAAPGGAPGAPSAVGELLRSMRDACRRVVDGLFDADPRAAAGFAAGAIRLDGAGARAAGWLVDLCVGALGSSAPAMLPPAARGGAARGGATRGGAIATVRPAPGGLVPVALGGPPVPIDSVRPMGAIVPCYDEGSERRFVMVCGLFGSEVVHYPVAGPALSPRYRTLTYETMNVALFDRLRLAGDLV